MSRAGAKSISATERERIMVLVWEFLGVDAGEEPIRGKTTALAKLVGVEQPAVTAWRKGTASPAESTCRVLALKLGRDPDFWRDGQKSKQPDAALVRLRAACTKLGLEESVVSVLLAAVAGEGTGVGDAKSELPEPLRHAALAAVHLLGFSLEQVMVEATELHVDTVRRQNRAFAKGLNASQWYADLSARLSGQRAGSGTRPRVVPAEKEAK